jgi:hypothetical protein
MCSEADPTQEALRDSQAAFTGTMRQAFSTAFANNQAILGNLTNILTKAIANPQGYTPAEMTALRTGVTDTVAQATKNATIAAGNYAATHGGADLGSGVTAQIEGGIQTGGMEEGAREQSQITIANAERQQQNYWNAISGLTQVGAAYNPTGYAGAETSSANATTAASQEVSAERQAGWQNAFGVVSGIAGLASAAAGIPKFGGGGGSASIPGSNYVGNSIG